MEIKTDYKAMLDKRELISFIPNGTSMWPTIKNGKYPVVIKRKLDRLKKYDVAFYKRRDKFILHRVIEVTEDGYIMCGDSLFFSEKVLEKEVFGVLVGFYRGKKYIDVENKKYIEQVDKLYKHNRKRKIKVSIYLFFVRAINKLKRIFKGKKND